MIFITREFNVIQNVIFREVGKKYPFSRPLLLRHSATPPVGSDNIALQLRQYSANIAVGVVECQHCIAVEVVHCTKYSANSSVQCS